MLVPGTSEGMLILFTQMAYFSQILFTNLSQSVLVSFSPLPR